MPNLPHFTIRESSKAKRVILKISDRHGLEVVIPQGFNRKQVPQIIREKREWIEKALRQFKHAGTISAPPPKLPETIHFKALNLDYQIEYLPVAIPFLELLHLNQCRLRISGKISDFQGCQELLKRWLQHQGRVHLIPWLAQVSSEIDLHYQKYKFAVKKVGGVVVPVAAPSVSIIISCFSVRNWCATLSSMNFAIRCILIIQPNFISFTDSLCPITKNSGSR